MSSSRQSFVVLFWIALVCASVGLGCMILAFLTPYWMQSWRRVHSPFANTGMWTICLSGYIKPKDPTLAAYVGCWWIHTSVFHDISNAIMPPWFRIVQFFVVITLLCNIAALILIVLFRFDGPRQALYGEKPWKMLYCDSIFLFAAALMVFIDSLIFAIKSIDPSWMPRPHLNYLSWSYGFNVLSGFFSAFGGICIFFMAMMVHEGLVDDGGGGVDDKTDDEAEHGVDDAGVAATPPAPPKYLSVRPQDQPAPQKMYEDKPSRFAAYHDAPVIQPYGGQEYPQPVRQYEGSTYAYPRRQLDSDVSKDTEV